MTGVLVGRDRGELRDRAALLAERRGDTADPDSFLAASAPSWIVGTVDEAAEQLGALREAGVARMMCQQLLHEDLDAVAVIGRELAPMLA
jgi:alkanesulfonate monooxygenase SsuD/methylene tetrahydromethanopterin reductase-like flavin-dependent oxidoreductase (luciferase family)